MALLAGKLKLIIHQKKNPKFTSESTGKKTVTPTKNDCSTVAI